MTRSYDIFNHSNDSSSTKAIPEGLVGKARLTLCPQDYGDQGLFHQTAYGLDYLQAVFTLVNGDYAGRTIEQIIAIAFQEQATRYSYDQRQTMSSWIRTGHSLITKVLQSAQRHDLEQSYKEHLGHNTPFDYSQLDGLHCAIMVGEGLYPPHRTMNKAEVAHIFAPPHHFHIDTMEQNLEIRAYPYAQPYRRYELFRDDILIAIPQQYTCLRSA